MRDEAMHVTPTDEEMAHERMVQADLPVRVMDWKGYVAAIGGTVAVLVIAVGAIRMAVTDTDLDAHRRTYYEPLLERVKSLESARETLNKDVLTLTGSINVLKEQLKAVETSQTRVESVLRESTAELKQLVRDIANKLDRYQSGRVPAPQGWWEDEWHLDVPRATDTEATRAVKRRGE